MQKLPLILLVDDEPATNYANERLLLRLGVAEEVLSVISADEALILLHQDPPLQPTLLLLDVAMPGLDGFEFVEAFQKLSPAQQAATQVVLLTGGLASRDIARLTDLPVAGLVIKPLTQEKVMELLQRHFQHYLLQPS